MLLELLACRITHYFLTSFLFFPLLAGFSVHITVSRLGRFFIRDHLLFNADEHFFHCSVNVPVFEKVELGRFNDSVCLVHGREIDF